MTPLPPPRSLVTSLISSIQSTFPLESSSNPLRDAPQPIQNALLTLHVLFPNELLPALDVLDRQLVTRLKLNRYETQDRHSQVYIVRSGQVSSRGRVANHTTSYEVRLDAWSCSCPAFAFSAFPAAVSENGDAQSHSPQHVHSSGGASWRFGGLTTGSDLPVCKHLLACVLVEHTNFFASFVEEREVSIEEIAGWAAGWGD